MNLSWLSGAAFAGGIAALAALLFALQRLRVRHREVEVVTTLFWREAIEETRARVFVQRFRHPWAYVLVLCIASLMWLAAAGPRLGGANEREHVLVVDASAGMQWGTRFADALNAARVRASELPRENTRILLAGERVDTLLDRDEELPLFDRRSEARKPDACPASVQRALFDLATTASGERGLSIEIFGDAPVAKDALALLPKYVEVERAETAKFERKDNAGIVALGVTEAASGAWDRVDVYCEIVRDIGFDDVATLDGDAEVAKFTEVDASPQRVRDIARDVPARGGRFEVQIVTQDAFAVDNTASIVLPDRPLIRVALSPKTPPIVRTAFGFDSGVTLVADNADVVVRHANEAFGGDAPAIELVDDESTPAFVVKRVAVVDATDFDAEGELRESFEQLGLSEIDSMDLAERAGKRIELTLENADRPGLCMWASLLEERFDFAQSRAFPLFLARSARWLARIEAIANTCAAGEFTQDGSQRLKFASGKQLDSVGAELRIPRAGEATNERGRAVYASLLDFDTSRTPADDGLAVSNKSHGASNSELLPWIVLLAIALLVVEWWLVRAEKIP
jgi:hypothetical protein